MFSGRDLPLGVDINDEFISIVSLQRVANSLKVRQALSLELDVKSDETFAKRAGSVLRKAVSSLQTRERRCVICVGPGDVVSRPFRLAPRMQPSEARRAAELEADVLVRWPAAERSIALDPLPGRASEVLLSIGRTGAIDGLVAIAESAGLKPIAVDVPACAWHRAVSNADAVLDCTTNRAVLTIFGDPVGSTQQFAARLVDERLATQIKSAVAEARREGVADVQRLCLIGTPFRCEPIAGLLLTDGYTVVPLTIDAAVAPLTALAYGLAMWSVGPDSPGAPC
jgi:Tfp pilus assembly PilM family ATPase